MKFKIPRLLLIFSVAYFLNSCSSDSPVIQSPSASFLIAAVPTYIYNSLENETLTLVNSYRVSIGLKTLEKNNYVSLKSEEHDNYMINNNVVNHDYFSTRSQNIIENLGAKRVGENIAYNYSTPKAVLFAWLESPEHKQCIEGDYTHFGISIRINAEGKKYYTNIFIKI
ncbi:MAG: CAP domain-containing protein [Flavobacterium sp.]|nr:CAP domain-containing protein [Flavobacterium sp.]